MAQAQLFPVAMPGNGLSDSRTAEELHEIQECERLVRFRDQVLSGVHPRIKPTHLTAKPTVSDGPHFSNEYAFAANYSTSPIAKTHNGVNGIAAKGKNVQAEVQRNHLSQALAGLGAPSSSGNSAGPSSRPFIPSGNAEINPVLLEKSDDLKKAEMRLQRQRIERSFQDELDKRRVGAKASLQSAELPVDVDLADVLSKAQALVQPPAAQPTDHTAANGSASGDDSFDDNTFYSSQHDTPEFLEEESRAPNKSPEDVEMLDESDYEPELDNEPASLVAATQTTESNIANQLQANAALQEKPTSTKIPTGPSSQQQQNPYTNARSSAINIGHGQVIPPRIPGLQTSQTAQTLEVVSSQDSGAEASNSEEASSMDKGKGKAVDHHRLHEVNRDFIDAALDRQQPPVMRGHNLSPIAPQPARVSPLAVARQPPAPQNDHIGRRATPPQVAALRKQPSGASSPDSSPQTSRSIERRKNKRKNKIASKKGKGKAPDNAVSPVIKAEPRSPSPMVAPEFTRPAKRQRQGQRPQGGLDYEEARYERPTRAGESHAERHEPVARVEERQSLGGPAQLIEESLPRREPPFEQARHGNDYYEPRRPTAVQYARPSSPGALYSGQRVPEERRTIRAVSHAVVERPYHEGPAPLQYYGSREGGMSVRPVVDRQRSRSPVGYDRPMSVMPPPRAPLRRIIVDEFGREYIEPPRPVAMRRPSAIPGYHLDDAEVMYERSVPARAVSRRPDAYEADGLMYGQPSPAYANPPYARRVVTQPELVGPDYRAYRERDYIPRPAGRPVEEIVSSRGLVEGQAGPEIPREYVARSASVRPGAEPYRYEVGGGYERRIVDEPVRDFARAASVRPVDPQRYEVRQGYEYVPVPARAGTVRPVESAQYGPPRDVEWSRFESVRPEQREYASRPEPSREMAPPMAPPDGRAYSVRPVEANSPAVVRQEYHRPVRPADGYYAQRPPAPADDDVRYVGQIARQDAYHPGQRGQ